MLAWTKKSQGNIILIFAIALLLVIPLMNVLIAKTIKDKDAPQTIQAPKAQGVVEKDPISPATKETFSQTKVSPIEILKEKGTSGPQKSQGADIQETNFGKEEEIIYEPSIKDNVLLQ